MIQNQHNAMFDIIRLSLWGTGTCEADQATFEEMQQQTLTVLPASVLSRISMTPELRQQWKAAILHQVSANVNLQRAQAELPVTVPYVILKGTAAAQYYPEPKYRAMGDIDIMTRRADFESACKSLLDAGYTENTLETVTGVIRHRGFIKNQVEVEVHAYYARLNDPDKSRYLDDLILDNINETHLLPDPVNGLVILEHISQHMEDGLGLRQIIDWMMFVHRCLPDDKWPAFELMAKQTGLLKLAVATTRMCEMFLGLPRHPWCADADEALCRQLMDYVLSCGNFGRKKNVEDFTSEQALTVARSPRALLAMLQSRGLKNWKACRKYTFLRPFAWLYQAGRYVRRGLSRDRSISRVKAEYQSAQARNALFDALEVTQSSKGLAVYRQGKYSKNSWK